MQRPISTTPDWTPSADVQALARADLAVRCLACSGLPALYRAGLSAWRCDYGDGFDAIRAKLRTAAQRYVADRRWQSGEGLVLCGPVGCGKTKLACAIVVEAIRVGAHARFRAWRQTLEEIKAGFRRAHDEDALTLDDLARESEDFDLLLLDDFGPADRARSATDWESDVARVIADSWSRAGRAVIVTANRNEAQLVRWLGDRVVVSRLFGNARRYEAPPGMSDLRKRKAKNPNAY